MNKLCFCFILQVGFSLCLCAQTDFSSGANSIVQDAVTEIICTSPINGTYKEKRTVKILNENGKGSANFYCSCDRFSSLRSFAGEVRDANGKVIRKIKKSELQSSEYSSDLANDNYSYSYEYIPPQYPVSVTYEIEIKYNDGLIGYPSFLPQRAYNQAVAQASYRIQTPADNPCRYRAKGIEADVKQQKSPDGTAWITEVSVQSLAPIKQEPFSAGFSDLKPQIYFAPQHFTFEGTQGRMDSWQAFGEWQYRLLEGRDQLPPALKQKLQELTVNCQSPQEKVAAVYKYLEASTRYVSIQLGIGGLQPMPATDVHRTGFGDCKGLSNYARAMLTELGISSYYTVISTDNKHLLSNFPSANQMNHVILQVPLPNDTLWLECTNPKLPLGFIHSSIAGHEAMLVTPEGGKIYRLPTYPDSLNTQVNYAQVLLTPEGSARIETRQTARLFQYQSNSYITNLEPTKQKDWLRSSINLVQADIESIQVKKTKQKEPQLDISYTLSSGQYGVKTGKRLFIPVNIFHKDFYASKEQEQRTQDIQIDYGYLDIDSICIQLPEGCEIESFPQTIQLQTRFGEFHSSIRQHERNIYIVHRLLFHQGTYPKEEYNNFLNFRKNVATQYQSKIIIKKLIS